jgi:phospholipid-binding lipoprotein MlaA
VIFIESSSLRLIAIVSAVIFMSVTGCAGSIPAAPKEERSPADPWEPLNRRISNFNEGLDKVTLKPLAKGYQAVLPEPMQRGVTNFSKNLFGPLYIINNLLQGKFRRSLSETGRFLANSTFGILGLVDVGADLGMETYREDFGQTLAVWGVPDGPFVVIPVLGPRTLRQATMIPLNFMADPLFHYDNDTARRWIYSVRLVDVRARLFSVDALVEGSFDRYLTIRESYLQNRLFLIFDGNPPEDEDFYDDFFDDDFAEEEDPQ